MPSTNAIITASGRSVEEIKSGIKIRMQNMVCNALEIGTDLTEIKEACKHGQWLPFLKEVGISPSSAANYMRVAKEVSANSKMAQLPYTKILALLAAPPEEREELAAAAEDMSAAEIRRLTEERNKAAEAANAETVRADQAEAQFQQLAKQMDEKEEAHQRDLRRCDEEAREEERERIQQEMKDLQDAVMRYASAHEDMKARLIEAENNRVEVEIEKIPEDYLTIKMQLANAEKSKKELMDAAAEAEERALAAEAELEAAQADGGEKEPAAHILNRCINTFFRECELMPFYPEEMRRDESAIRSSVAELAEWCRRMDEALDRMALEAEAKVV